jgi:hypothetical protein
MPNKICLYFNAFDTHLRMIGKYYRNSNPNSGKITDMHYVIFIIVQQK